MGGNRSVWCIGALVLVGFLVDTAVASPSDLQWAASQKELAAALKSPDAAYEQFKARFAPVAAGQRVAQTAESQKLDAHRKAAFLANVALCAVENDKGSNTHVLGITRFSDLTPAEFASQYLQPKKGKRHTPARHHNHTAHYRAARPLAASRQSHNALPACNVDWRKPALNRLRKNVVTPVKDQGACGSCFSFAATAGLESWWMMKGGPALDLSEQQLLNCNTYGMDCNVGGSAVNSWDWVRTNNGISTEANDPYDAGDGTYGSNGNGVGTCNIDPPAFSVAKLPPTYGMMYATDAQLVSAIKIAPIDVGVCASNAQFQNYYSGVISCSQADSTSDSTDHEIQMVGCGMLGSTPVYIVKNSWGQTDWGVYGGYAYIARNPPSTYPTGTCGITSEIAWLPA